MTEPVRLRLSRAKGFDLQALSIATNGLPAINVARPTKWGNPFRVGMLDQRTGGTMDADTAVERYLSKLLRHGREVEVAHDLRGKNLACWCRPGQPCHADILLEIANSSNRKD
ncbi:MAG: DUF4326 domain-containing protein [Mesorhizobium sp.]|uniref:DUF4326 domain-containing protein n=1 Tax=Mesorhizobium sp. TaxID=1871066 RepID=UPI000FE4E2C6|nr:DUF4326 domain-containing protein [Mesorhizobium sp.]RWB85962.1 MAG: DUF4326 domain-containing protein [Mesorhizobium sp.]